MLIDFIEARLKELGKKKHDLVKEGIISAGTMSNLRKVDYRPRRAVLESLAGFLQTSQGELQAAMAIHPDDTLRMEVEHRKQEELVAVEKIETTCDKKADMVNHPPHYQLRGFPSGFETIDVIAAVTADLTGMEAVCTANALKYLIRWKHKNGVEDLKKARWYLDRLIGECES